MQQTSGNRRVEPLCRRKNIPKLIAINYSDRARCQRPHLCSAVARRVCPTAPSPGLRHLLSTCGCHPCLLLPVLVDQEYGINWTVSMATDMAGCLALKPRNAVVIQRRSSAPTLDHKRRYPRVGISFGRLTTIAPSSALCSSRDAGEEHAAGLMVLPGPWDLVRRIVCAASQSRTYKKVESTAGHRDQRWHQAPCSGLMLRLSCWRRSAATRAAMTGRTVPHVDGSPTYLVSLCRCAAIRCSRIDTRTRSSMLTPESRALYMRPGS